MYKTKHSVFTVNEIEEFCNEWKWIHVREFMKQSNHKYPYYMHLEGLEGIGEFMGIDGNVYRTHITLKSIWVGDIKNDKINKEEFKNYLKDIAGDRYGKNREHYYFYDVLLTESGIYDCEAKEFDKNYEPNEYSRELHGKPYYNILLSHVGVSNGKMWEFKKYE